MRAIELYSGIGGMHYALRGSSVGEEIEVVFAADLNPTCNEIYRHNFPDTGLHCRNMNSLKAEEINDVAPDLILMSPPCQPFTRLGKQADVQDPRNVSFLRFIELIPDLKTVRYMLVENVRGFEVSETRRKLLEALQKSRFRCEEYLLNPVQFEICNSRLRYYLLAKKSEETVSQDSHVNYEPPPITGNSSSTYVIPRKIENVLEYDLASDEWEENLIPLRILDKYCLVSDIVGYDSQRSCCFTRGYTRLFESTGSLVANISSNQIRDCIEDVRKVCEDYDAREKLLKSLKVRHFTPKEIAKLMCFPKEFSFPKHITMKQQYKALCNSINVYVVSYLISYLIKDFLPC